MKPLSLVLLASVLPASGFAATPSLPDAGRLLQQANPAPPAVPTPVDAGLRIEPVVDTRPPASEAFLVKSIEITGNTLIDSATLHALVASAEGQSQSLPQLGQWAARITAYYRDQGYPLARAIIPAQVIRDGVVVFEIIEARYGKISVNNRSPVRDGLLQATLAPLQSGQPVGEAPMNRALLLLSDIPGLRSNALLKPGDALGTSDLEVNVDAGPLVSGKLALDNYGDTYTGRSRGSAAINLYNLLHAGDVLGISVLSAGHDMNDGRVGYEVLLNGEGTRLGASYAQLHYQLGDTLTALDADGSAGVSSVWVKHPVRRSQTGNLYGQLQYDQIRLRDSVQIVALENKRQLRNWTLSLNGDLRDSFLSGGINTASVSWTGGEVDFSDTDAALADQASARTAGRFAKWNFGAARWQRLGSRDSVYLSYAGQWAADNLDASMKMSVGGPYSVRAYAPGALSGDAGRLASLELRHELGNLGGQWQAVAFIDSAQVTVNRSPWADGANRATLSGAGLGLNWSAAQQLSARLYLATRLGAKPELLPNAATTQAWAELRWDL